MRVVTDAQAHGSGGSCQASKKLLPSLRQPPDAAHPLLAHRMPAALNQQLRRLSLPSARSAVLSSFAACTTLLRHLKQQGMRRAQPLHVPAAR